MTKMTKSTPTASDGAVNASFSNGKAAMQHADCLTALPTDEGVPPIEEADFVIVLHAHFIGLMGRLSETLPPIASPSVSGSA